MINFDFAIDGKTDLMSVNPLEMTNFEMTGAIFGVLGIIITLVVGRLSRDRQKPHEFVARETDVDAIL
jgi:hypothetical protein